MKFLVTTSLALWGAMLVSGCGSGNGPPTTPSFNPFGTDPPGTTSEPPGGPNNPLPTTGEGGSGGTVGTGGGGGTVATGGSGGSQLSQLCATACAQFEAFCSSYQSTTCPTECANGVSNASGCESEYQAVVMCYATTSYFSCNGSSTPSAPYCASEENTLATCAGGA